MLVMEIKLEDIVLAVNRAHCEIRKLREENYLLREALQPFANYARAFGEEWPDSTSTCCLFMQVDGTLNHKPEVNLGNCRKALKAIEEIDKRNR